MKTNRNTNRVITTALFLLLTVAVIFTLSACGKKKPSPATEGGSTDPVTDPTTDPSTEPVADVVLFSGSDFDYEIVFAPTDVRGANDGALALRSRLNTLGITTSAVAEPRASGAAHEILFGAVNRPGATELAAKVEAATESGGIGWGYSYADGKLYVFATNVDGYTKALDTLFADYENDGTMTLPGDLSEVHSMTASEYQAILDARAESERLAKIDDLQRKIAAFETSGFGGTERTPMPATYPSLDVNPTVGQHPRLLITEDSLAGIRDAMEWEESATAKSLYLQLADTAFDGKLPAVAADATRATNYDGQKLAIIEAKALAYQLTGNELYGYEAIYAIKNFMRDLKVVNWGDSYRMYGHTMLVAGEVYDWCYDLMTDLDKTQFVIGAEYLLCRDGKMEVGFPPTGQSAISSHGSEAQLMRDYLGFSIAVYDECPDWWNFVGGRFYAEYVPFRNLYYQSGLGPQGSGLYGGYRHNFDLWAAWMVKTMSGTQPFSDKIANVVPSFLTAEMPLDEELFATGDTYHDFVGYVDLGDGEAWAPVGKVYMLSTLAISSALFNNGTTRAAAKYYSRDFTEFTYANNYLNPIGYLIFSGAGTKTADSRHAGLPTLLYNGSPVGMITSREAWDDPDSAAVFMKIGERTTANHEHQDSGSFEIYYKGKLTTDSGIYSGYGSDHHFYYHQATVAHNSLLIYNPSLSTKNNGWYSGGQRKLSETASMEQWLSETYHTGTVTGVATKLTAGEGSRPDYAYLAGDLTPAYDSVTVDGVERRMLALYTGDEKMPVIFVVFDQITSDSPDFKKTFLLHSETEPSVDGKTVTIVNGDGKLTLTNLLGGDSIEKLGGEGQNWLIGGRQCEIPNSVLTDKMWGRVEISPALGNKTDLLLNVLLVSDADAASLPTPILVSGTGITGASVSDRVTMFATSFERTTDPMTFTVPGDGNRTYYISGVSAGTWGVSVDGVKLGDITATADGGFLTFTAPAGTVVLTPGSDIVPADSGKIVFAVGAGETLPESTPAFYKYGEGFDLDSIVPTAKDKIFKGWYTDAGLSTPVHTIPTDATGTFRVYPKWFVTAFNEDFSEGGLLVEKKNGSYHGLTLIGQYEGCRFSTDRDGNGSYLLWERGSGDPTVSLEKSLYDNRNGSNEISFSLTLANVSGKTPMSSVFRIRGKSSADTVALFSITSSGTVLLGGKSGHAVLTLTEVPQTIRIVMDFELGVIKAIADDGKITDSVDFQQPGASGVASTLDWFRTISDFVFNWYSGSGAATDAIKVYKILVIGGNSFEKLPPVLFSLKGGSFAVTPTVPETVGTKYTLPTPFLRGGSFLGWYLSADYAGTPVTEVEIGQDPVTVYAKYDSPILNEDFEGISIKTTDTNPTILGVTYVTEGKKSTYETKSEDGNQYLVVYSGGTDPAINMQGSLPSKLNGATKMEVSVKLRLHDGHFVGSVFRLRGNGNYLDVVPTFSTSEDGSVSFSGKKVGNVSAEWQTLTMTIDFATGDTTVKLGAGEAVSATLASPTVAEGASFLNWMKGGNAFIFNWYYSGSDNSAAFEMDDFSIHAIPAE